MLDVPHFFLRQTCATISITNLISCLINPHKHTHTSYITISFRDLVYPSYPPPILHSLIFFPSFSAHLFSQISFDIQYKLFCSYPLRILSQLSLWPRLWYEPSPRDCVFTTDYMAIICLPSSHNPLVNNS